MPDLARYVTTGRVTVPLTAVTLITCYCIEHHRVAPYHASRSGCMEGVNTMVSSTIGIRGTAVKGKMTRPVVTQPGQMKAVDCTLHSMQHTVQVLTMQVLSAFMHALP